MDKMTAYVLPTQPPTLNRQSKVSTTSSAPHSPSLENTSPNPSTFDEPEIDNWCSVCDRLIVPPRGRAAWDDEDEEMATMLGVDASVGAGKMSRKVKTDCDGRQHVIVPVAAKLPAKKGGKGPTKPGLRRSSTATQRLAQLTAPSQRPSPIEPSRPAPTSPTEHRARTFNMDLYCSFACAETDVRKSGENAEELELEMNALWGTTTSTGGASRRESDVGSWRSRGSVGAQSQSQASPSPLATGPMTGNQSSSTDDVGYFDMATYGVQHGLRERDRRRSLYAHAQSLGSVSSAIGPTTAPARQQHLAISAAPMHRAGSGSQTSGLSRGAISSSDSLSSMWSAGSEGRAFSEDSMEHRWSHYGSSINNNTTAGGSAGPRNALKGMTPLRPARSDSSGSDWASAGAAVQARPSLNGHRRSSQVASSSIAGMGMPASHAANGARRQSSSGSAPVASLLTSYAMSFPRTASAVDVHRKTTFPSPTLPSTSEDGFATPSANERIDSAHTSARRRRESSTDTSESITSQPAQQQRLQQHRRTRTAFSPVCCASLGSGSLTGAVKSRSSISDEASTPTQSLLGPSHVWPGAAGCRSSGRSSLPAEQEEEQDRDATLGRRCSSQTRSSLSQSSTSTGTDTGMGNGSSPARSLRWMMDSPTVAITVGDEIIPRPIASSYAAPPFCRSLNNSNPPGSGTSISRPSRTVSHGLPQEIARGLSRSSHIDDPAGPRPTRGINNSLARPAHLTTGSRTWSWDALERSGGKMYDLPPSVTLRSNHRPPSAGGSDRVGGVGGTSLNSVVGDKRDGGRLFYFHH